MIKTHKRFGRKTYTIFDWCQTKREAIREAKQLRKAGWFARIISAGTGYHVWRVK